MKNVEPIFIRACAKVNLTMEVLGKRPDGYHNIRSVMQFVTLCDTVELAPAEQFSFWCDDPALEGEDNLAVKAFHLMENRFHAKPLSIRLIKKIPYMSGLGGGSADCAAVLAGVNHLQQLGLGYAELLEAGRSLGADVPACLAGGALLAEGIGERLTQLTQQAPLHFCILKPTVAFSTPEMYARMDAAGSFPAPVDPQGMLEAVEQGDALRVAQGLCNSFEAVARPVEPIQTAKRLLLDSGALAASMTGAGSAVFGIYADEATAQRAYQAMAATGVEVYCCQSVSPF